MMQRGSVAHVREIVEVDRRMFRLHEAPDGPEQMSSLTDKSMKNPIILIIMHMHITDL